MKAFVSMLFVGLAPLCTQAGKPVTCADAAGKTHIGDARPRECTVPSDTEIEAVAASAAAAAASMQAAEDKRLRERGLLRQYPNEAKVEIAREIELQPLLKRLAASTAREAQLAAERKRIDQDAAFFAPPHRMDGEVQGRLNDNNAWTAAARDINAGIRREIEAVNASWDARLVQMYKLWSPRR